MRRLTLTIVSGVIAAILLGSTFAYSASAFTTARHSAGSILLALFYWIKSQPADSTKLLMSTTNSTSTQPAQIQISTVNASADRHNAVKSIETLSLNNGTKGHLEILFVNDTQTALLGQNGTQPNGNSTIELGHFDIN